MLVLVTLDVPATAELLGVGGLVGLAIGVLLVRGPSVRVIEWSSLVGVGWLVAFGGLTVSNLEEPAGEWLSTLVLAALGVGAAGLAYSRRGMVAPARAGGPSNIRGT
jgi:hypothetical protein